MNSTGWINQNYLWFKKKFNNKLDLGKTRPIAFKREKFSSISMGPYFLLRKESDVGDYEKNILWDH